MNQPTRRLLSLKRDPGASHTPKIEERLHKVLAQAGLGSRRSLEERISQGLVQVNGNVAELGQLVRSGDRIELDGKVFVATVLTEPSRVLIYNKPEGEVTTRDDPEGRPTVFDHLPNIKGARWIAIGRLDINTTGLLLLSTDGEIANAMMHPAREIEREYICRIQGQVSEQTLQTLRRGVELEDGPARFDEVEAIGSSDRHQWFRVVVKEGRNREVRRLWESQGFPVSRLKRVRFGSIHLPRPLLRGRCEELSAEAVQALKRELGLSDAPPVLTLQPVLGQRRARAEVHINPQRGQQAWVNGQLADEANELRRFDRLHEEPSQRHGRSGKPGRRGAAKPGRHQPPRVGNIADAQPDPRPRGKPGTAGKPAPGANRGRRRPRGERPAQGYDPATGAFRSWYVPEGVDTAGSQPPRPRGGKPGPRSARIGHDPTHPGKHPSRNGPAANARPGGPPSPRKPGPAGHRGRSRGGN